METFSILLFAVVTPEAVAEFVKANGGTIIDERSAYGSIERGSAAVYVGLEPPQERDWDVLGNVPEAIREYIKSVLLLTVSRQSGSKYLAFEIADEATARWNGKICWDGLTQWEAQYQQWHQSIDGGLADVLPRID